MVLVVVALAAGCGGGSDDDAGVTTTARGAASTTTAAPATTTATEPTTTSAPATTTTEAATTTTGTSNGPGNPEDAARGLYASWTAGSRDAAEAFATDDVVDQLFASPGQDANWTFQGCEGVAGGAYCSFSYEGGSVQMHLVNLSVVGDGSATGYKVDELQFLAD